MVIGTAAAAYLTLYVVSARVVAREVTASSGQGYYTFFPGHIELEHSLALFFAPLIYADEKLTGRKHQFDMVYIHHF